MAEEILSYIVYLANTAVMSADVMFIVYADKFIFLLLTNVLIFKFNETPTIKRTRLAD